MKKTPLVRRTNFGDKDKTIETEAPVFNKIDLSLNDNIPIKEIKPLIFSNLPLPKGQITDKELGFLEDKK